MAVLLDCTCSAWLLFHRSQHPGTPQSPGESTPLLYCGPPTSPAERQHSPPPFARMSGRTVMPRWRSTRSAPGVVGPLAASITTYRTADGAELGQAEAINMV